MDNINWVNVEEGSKILGISAIHLRKLLKIGKIPFLNIGAGKRRLLRIDKAELEKFISGGGVK